MDITHDNLMLLLDQISSSMEMDTTIVNDSLAGGCSDRACQMINIRVKNDVDLVESSITSVQTKIWVDGPINKFTMLVKRHEQHHMYPILKSTGYIRQDTNKCLWVQIENPHNYPIKLHQDDIVGVLILTEYEQTFLN